MALHGDLNNDGKVDAEDLALLRELVRNKPLFEQLSAEEKALLDINNDGSVDYDDVIRLIQTIQCNMAGDRDVESCVNTLRQKMLQR